MSESMIDRVAKALAKADATSSYKELARAAIEAMREPTDTMLVATEDVVSGYDDFAVGDGTIYLSYPGYYDDAIEAWNAMIDAALEEDE